MIGRCVNVAARLVCITLFATQALAQTAVQQSGPVTDNSAVMWARDHALRQAAGASGDVAGKMITGGFSAVGNICSYTNTTDQSGIGLCLDAVNGRLVYNGVGYPVSGGGGNVVGPATSIIGELASFNSLVGTALKMGAAAIHDNKTTAFTVDGYAFGAFSQTSSDATTAYIQSCVYGTCNAAIGGNYDGVRSVVISPATQVTDLANGMGIYVINSTPRAGPSYPSVPVTTGVNVASICDADGCGTWGYNAILTDNRGGQTPSVHGPRFLFGGEADFNVTSTNTQIVGFQIGGQSVAQPTGAVGYGCLRLDASNGTVAKWSNCVVTQDAATLVFADIGAQATSGTSVNSQNINMNYFDGAGVRQTLSIAQTPSGLLFASTGAAGSAGITLPASGIYSTGDLGGFNINSRTVLVGNAATLSVGSDVGYTTQNYGNASAAVALIGTNVTLSPTAGNAVIVGQRLKLPSIAVAALPACNAGAVGSLLMVNDSNTAVFNATIAAGGANIILAACDGTDWKVH